MTEEELQSYTNMVSRLDNQHIMLVTAILDIYLEGLRDGTFSKRVKVTFDNQCLEKLFRQYIAARIPNGYKVLKQRSRNGASFRIFSTQLSDSGMDRNIQREINRIRDNGPLHWHDCDQGTIGLWLMQQELMSRFDFYQVVTQSLSTISDIGFYSGDIEVDVHAMLINNARNFVLHPVLLINSIADAANIMNKMHRFYEYYKGLLECFNDVRAQTEMSQPGYHDTPWTSSTDSAATATVQRQMTEIEQAMLALRNAAERARQGVAL